MKPDKELREAWQQYMTTAVQAKIARVKSEVMFKQVTQDLALYRRADTLARRANKLYLRAWVDFNIALKKKYANRYRVVRINEHGCKIQIREPYRQEETAVLFGKQK